MASPTSKVAVSWLEIILVATLVISAMGIWAFTDQQVNQSFKSKEPSLEISQQEFGVTDTKRSLTLVQDELTVTRKKLLEQQIEISRLNGKLGALETASPKLLKAKQDKNSLPSDIVKTYEGAQVEKQTIRGMIRDLKVRAKTLEERVTRLTKKAFDAQESASEKFESAKIDFGWKKRWQVLFQSIKMVMAMMIVSAIILWCLVKRKTLAVNLSLVFLGAIALQAILFGYQSFGVMGAALASTFLLFILLAALSHQTS